MALDLPAGIAVSAWEFERDAGTPRSYFLVEGLGLVASEDDELAELEL